MPFSILPNIAWLVVIGGIFAGLFWLAEELRIGAKAEVRAEYAEAARKKNVDITAFNSAEEAVDAVVAAKVAEAVAASKNVPSSAKATVEQAAALNAIRRAGQ